MKALNVGFGNFIITDRILGVFNPDSAPMKRVREEAKSQRNLIDATQGRRTRAIILLDNGYLVLSGIQTETLVNRINSSGEVPTAK